MPAFLLNGVDCFYGRFCCYHTTVIVELEVSNRSIVGMRQDFVHYFDEATVHSVVGIKMLAGDRKNLAMSR